MRSDLWRKLEISDMAKTISDKFLCPNCKSRQNIFALKGEFQCEKCGALLHSNAKEITIIAIIVIVVIASPISWLFFDGNVFITLIVDLSVATVVFFTIYCLFFRVE